MWRKLTEHIFIVEFKWSCCWQICDNWRVKAGADSTYVENWSEGCQVFKRSKDFDEFMAICRKAREKHGNSFTYTLIESTDIK